jgi:hypothetical protein
MRPRDSVEGLDSPDYEWRLRRQIYIKTYVKVLERASEIWGMVFKKTDNSVVARKLTRFRRALANHTKRRFV